MKRFIVWFCRFLCLCAAGYVAIIMALLMGSTWRPVIYAANVGTVFAALLVVVVFLCTFIPVKYTGSNAQRTPLVSRSAAPVGPPCGGCTSVVSGYRCIIHGVNVCRPCSIKHMGVGCAVQPLPQYNAVIDHLEGKDADVQR